MAQERRSLGRSTCSLPFFVSSGGTLQGLSPPEVELVFVRQLRGPHLSTCPWWSRRSSMALTAATSPSSLPQSSTGQIGRASCRERVERAVCTADVEAEV